MWDRLLDRMLQATVRDGTLEVRFADGRVRRYGQGAPEVAVRIDDAALARRLVLQPDMALGDGYMDEGLRIADDDLPGLLVLLQRNAAAGRGRYWRYPLFRLQRLLARLDQVAPAWRAQVNVSHHYDLDSRLYALFLDADRQYSCGYFQSPADTLETAQARKKDLIARKLCLAPGMRVLDIGCGWGGLAITLARDHGARVVGVTLSAEQLEVAHRRVAAAGLASMIELRLLDYRAIGERFDRIVSVGMFEHVGQPQYDTFFARLAACLDPDGVALLHTIGRGEVPSITSPWIRRHIFPGGHIPSLSEILPPIEASGLWTTDIEVWRLHYAETLRHWRQRFEANIDAVRDLYDARFCRMWRYYLVASETAFRETRQGVFQIQLAHRADTVPLTRDYLLPPAQAAGVRSVAE